MRGKAMTTPYGMILAVLLLLVTGTAHCQTPTTRHWLFEAKNCLRTADNTGHAEDFDRAKALLSTYTAGDEHQALVEYYLGYADYRLGVVVYRMDKEKAIVYLDSAVEHLERAIEAKGDFAEAHALLASCCGIKISFAPFKAIVLGPRSGREMQKARELAPGNPRIALLDAIGTYNTPALFGGGRDKGLEALKKAAELFDRWQIADSLQPDWGAAEVYAWIGVAYLDRNETILARRALESALRINPDYGWVRYALLPKATTPSGAQ
jgi:tetratricopeptide (TPR) repeat protein